MIREGIKQIKRKKNIKYMGSGECIIFSRVKFYTVIGKLYILYS